MKHKKTGRVFALKMLSKALVLRTKQLDHILCEKEVLEALTFPFIVNVYATFQDEYYLYLVLEYSIGGEFFTHLRKANRFPNDTARFYAAGVALTFEYLHNRNIIYRDLKPENLLLDSAGHLKVCDFGFAKTVEPGTKSAPLSWFNIADNLAHTRVRSACVRVEEGSDVACGWAALGRCAGRPSTLRRRSS